MKTKGAILAIVFLLFNFLYCKAQVSIIPFVDDSTRLFGYKDTITNKVVIAPKYTFADEFSEGLAGVNIGGAWEYATDYEDDYEDDYSDERTFSGGKWGFIDKTGKLVVPLKYDDGSRFSDGMAIVKIGTKQGCINKSGAEIIPVKYDKIDIENQLYKVILDEKVGYYDKSGKILLPANYIDIILSSNLTTALVQNTNMKCGLMDLKMKNFIVQPQLDSVLVINQLNNFIASKSNQFAVYDFTGKVIIPFAKYSKIENLDGNLISVTKENTTAVCDVSEKFIIPFNIYQNISSGYCYLIRTIAGNPQTILFNYLQVSKEGKWGCIDYEGKPLIPLEYDEAIQYGDTISALKGKEWLCIDNNNKIILSLDTAIYKHCQLYYDYSDTKYLASFTVNGNEYKMNMQKRIEGDRNKYFEDLGKVGVPVSKKPMMKK